MKLTIPTLLCGLALALSAGGCVSNPYRLEVAVRVSASQIASAWWT